MENHADHLVNDYDHKKIISGSVRPSKALIQQWIMPRFGDYLQIIISMIL
jgi:hypothetical protein